MWRHDDGNAAQQAALLLSAALLSWYVLAGTAPELLVQFEDEKDRELHGERLTGRLSVHIARILGLGLVTVVTISWILASLVSICLPLPAGKRRAALQGRVILVTGGGSGIGAATCRQLANVGAIVVIWDIQLKAAQAVARDIAANGGHAYAWKVDLTDRRAVRTAAEAVRKELRAEVFGLVNNAGIVSGAQLLDLRPEQIERTMGVNVLAHFWMLQEFLPAMLHGACAPRGVESAGDQRAGHVVTVASTMSFSSASGLTDYVASKHAVWGMHECLRLELAQLQARGKAYVGCASFGDVPWFVLMSSCSVDGIPHDLCVQVLSSALLLQRQECSTASGFLGGAAHFYQSLTLSMSRGRLLILSSATDLSSLCPGFFAGYRSFCEHCCQWHG
jgi:NAD(P)-dependent dehydrogenase (short-subunit alcohol dehydrogenase family)